MERFHPTLDDVALKAGVSRAQASRALRGDAGVNEAKRQQVQKAAAELGYRANAAARALASNRSSIVGVMIGEPMNPYHMEMASAISDELLRRGFDPAIQLGKVGQDMGLAETERLLNLRAEGAILIGTPHDLELLQQICARLPCVYLGSDVTHLGISCVLGDDEVGARAATDYLLGLGHRRVAHITGGGGAGAGGRRAGYRAAMEAAGLPALIHEGWFDLDGGRDGVNALMARPQRPTAIFCANDRIAIGAINQLRGLGYRVPEDVSVVGFDDSLDARSESLSLTSVHQPSGDFGRDTVALLEERLRSDGKDLPATARVVPVTLVRRGSSAPPVG
ncbi:LacI family DNA-binding transcriptional regulator [Acidimangrovimonas sediminis]|uniref:LacI family DNA-binding transcriptional regulator n=1 Tax=Acidimangrovimonas sediminis TaxID=2056283 RepID=UPI000C80BB27|nr:LacI family DNA-binding transcriptional regulator [Acidimangrovimonas sediminis]